MLGRVYKKYEQVFYAVFISGHVVFFPPLSELGTHEEMF